MVDLALCELYCLQEQMKTSYERSLEGKRDYIARITMNGALAHVLPKIHGKPNNISPIPPLLLQMPYNNHS